MRHNLFSWLVSASTLAHAFEYWAVLKYTRNEHVGDSERTRLNTLVTRLLLNDNKKLEF